MKLFDRFLPYIRIFLGMVFLYAAIDKIQSPAQFAEVIYHYKILPLPFINLCAIIIPWIEIGIGLSLIFDISADIGLLLLSGLTLVFVGLIFSAMARGLNIECGCFSNSESYVGWERIFEDFLILIAAGTLFIRLYWPEYITINR